MSVTSASPKSWQRCIACGDRLGELDPRARCDCGGLLDIVHAAPPSSGEELRQLLHARRTESQGPASSGVWRFRELVLPSAGLEVVSHPEGNTPLLERESISRWAEVTRLDLKHEGHNPTGSFKDRGMTVGITQARRIDARAAACASTGNTAASLAAYAPGIAEALVATAAGLAAAIPAVIFYNHCLARVRSMDAKIDEFIADMIHRVQGRRG